MTSAIAAQFHAGELARLALADQRRSCDWIVWCFRNSSRPAGVTYSVLVSVCTIEDVGVRAEHSQGQFHRQGPPPAGDLAVGGTQGFVDGLSHRCRRRRWWPSPP